MGPAEPCNHEQMTELPGSASKKLARVLNASSQPAWAKSLWFILQKLSKTVMDSLVLSWPDPPGDSIV